MRKLTKKFFIRVIKEKNKPWVLANFQGFTLVEIMIALAILAMSLLSLYMALGNSLTSSDHGEKIQTASLLARQLMTEKVLELKKDLKKGSFPDAKEVETGEFEGNFEDYRWEFEVREVVLPIDGASQGAEQQEAKEESTPRGNEANQAPASAQRSLGQIISKKVKEEIREINVRVIWDELGEEQSIQVTSHLTKL